MELLYCYTFVMKTLHILIVVTVIFLGASLYFFLANKVEAPSDGPNTSDGVVVSAVSHASFVLEFAGLTIFNDPVGDFETYVTYGVPDLILLSDIHGDHLDIQTLINVAGEETVLVAPQAVLDKLPLELHDKTVVMANEDFHQVGEMTIEAIPMYNLPPANDTYHVKGRGNGYVLEYGETRVYIAGDTADIPEMRSLENIDIAFIPMNLPYTMDVDTAAEAVLAFAPKVVYPYHYRGTEGLSDIAEFTRMVAVKNSAIEVRNLDWYPAEVDVTEE